MFRESYSNCCFDFFILSFPLTNRTLIIIWLTIRRWSYRAISILFVIINPLQHFGQLMETKKNVIIQRKRNWGNYFLALISVNFRMVNRWFSYMRLTCWNFIVVIRCVSADPFFFLFSFFCFLLAAVCLFRFDLALTHTLLCLRVCVCCLLLSISSCYVLCIRTSSLVINYSALLFL